MRGKHARIGLYLPLYWVLAMALHAGSTGGATSVAATAFPLLAPNGSKTAPSYSFSTDSGVGFYLPFADHVALAVNGKVGWLWRLDDAGTNYGALASDAHLGWADTTDIVTAGSIDVRLYRDNAAVLALKNGDTAQTFRIYGASTGSKYIAIAHDGTNATLGASSGNLTFNTHLTSSGNVRVAHGTSALATSATEGFFHLQSCAGIPTGTPASIPTGQKPTIIDSNADQLNFYSTSWKALPRTLDVNVAAVGCVNATNSNLISFAIPANVLATNNKCVRVRAYGTTANNVAGKNLFFVVGSQTVLTTALTASIAGQWEVEALITRTGGNTQDIVARTLQGATLIFDQELTAGTQTDTGIITIKCVAQGGASNDIVQEGMVTEVIN